MHHGSNGFNSHQTGAVPQGRWSGVEQPRPGDHVRHPQRDVAVAEYLRARNAWNASPAIALVVRHPDASSGPVVREGRDMASGTDGRLVTRIARRATDAEVEALALRMVGRSLPSRKMSAREGGRKWR